MLDTPIDFAKLQDAVFSQRSIPDDSIHGLEHWKQVEYNGLLLLDFTGADVDVVRLFSIFHDSRRISDGYDAEHGKFGAHLAKEWLGKYYLLENSRFDLLYRACMEHTITPKTGNLTIDTCFDADRLDLPRAGIMPSPQKMATEIGARIAALAIKEHIDLNSYRIWLRSQSKSTLQKKIIRH